MSTIEIVKAKPSTIINKDNNSVCSWSNNVKNHEIDRINFVPYQEQYSAQVSNINIGFRGDNQPQHSYRLFVTTFLGYGANEALARHQRSLLFTQIPSKLSDRSW